MVPAVLLQLRATECGDQSDEAVLHTSAQRARRVRLPGASRCCPSLPSLRWVTAMSRFVVLCTLRHNVGAGMPGLPDEYNSTARAGSSYPAWSEQSGLLPVFTRRSTLWRIRPGSLWPGTGERPHMLHRTLRTVLVGLAIALAFGACEQGPGAQPTSPPKDSNNITRTYTIRSSQFRITDISGVGYAELVHDFPEITSAVLSRGLVHAYLQTNTPGDEAWGALPLSVGVGISPTTVTLDLTYAYEQGKVGFAIYSNVPARLLRIGLSTLDGWKFRVVVDPS